jgi:hypothetical protein
MAGYDTELSNDIFSQKEEWLIKSPSAQDEIVLSFAI